MIQPEIEPADQGQTLIAIAWAIDSCNPLIASGAPVFGRPSTVSQDENVLFACGSAYEGGRAADQGQQFIPVNVWLSGLTLASMCDRSLWRDGRDSELRYVVPNA